MTNENIAEMPTMVQEQFLKEHEYADDPRNAHPIDRDILHDVCDTKMGPILIEYDLALLQAVAVREVLPYSVNPDDSPQASDHGSSDHCDTETWIERDGDMHYYQAQSVTFYDLLSMAKQRYERVYVEVEDVPELAEVHTRQYLRGVHGYEGDFGGQVANDDIDKEHEPTLCSAQNDEHRLRDEEPEDAHYAFTDARGLVIEEGTHPE